MNLLKLFKKPQQQPLPEYPKLDASKVPAGSALIFYGSPGNKATETVGARLYGHKYNPPAFHAALTLDNGEFLNVGATRTIKPVTNEYKTERRVDCIVYDISDTQREQIVTSGHKDVSQVNSLVEKIAHKPLPDYAVTDFLRFGFKWFKPSKKDFCSENVVEHLAEVGVTVSDLEPVNTAPWDLVEWAEANPKVAKIYTLWEGEVFKQKLGR